MRILIKNTTLISMDETRPKKQENMDVLVEDDRIIKIGKYMKINADEEIDGTNKVLMPGFINTHAHIPMSIFREIADGCSMQEWLKEKIWPIEETLIGEDIYNSSILTFNEMIETGTTMVNDLYFMSEFIANASIQKDVRIELTRTLMDSDGKGNERFNQLEELIDKYNNINGKVSINIGIQGLYACSPEYLKKALDLARKYSLNVHMHFCENEKEVEDIKSLYNVSYPAEVLQKFFGGVNTILAHCVKLEDKDMKIIKDMKMHVSHCPVSNLRLGCGIAQIEKMRNMGINIALGTDGQGSGSNMDMFEIMKFASLLQKGVFEIPESMPAYEVLKMATINGAKALKKEHRIGSIEIGKKADLILIDLDTTITTPINDIYADIIYNAKGSNIVMTMIDGKKVYSK